MPVKVQWTVDADWFLRDHDKILRAARRVVEDGTAHPTLIGSKNEIVALAERIDVPLDGSP